MAVRKIFIAGAGEMGQGIAQSAARAGISVVLADVNASRLAEGMAGIEAGLNQAIERWSITGGEKKAILSRIETVVGLHGAEDCDFAIEAVPELLDL